MHYIVQQLDGSLAACDKTHHIRVYSNLNQGHTTLSFAYYPQFWLAAPERPVFDKTLYQLLLKQVYRLQVPVFLCGYATWSLTARREHKSRMFEYWVLSRTCLQAASMVHYTTSCKHSLMLLRRAEIIARNMLS